MAPKPAFLLALLALTALAGCSDAPPSGDLASAAMPLTADGDTTNQYQAAEYPAGQVPVIGQDPTFCPPAGTPLPQCVPASSSFRVHLMALPQPDANGYHAFLVGSAGERDLGALMMDAANMWEVAANYTEDLTDQYQTVEVRMGSFVLATASAAEGTQTFALAEGLSAISATASYRGKVLNVTVSGLPEGSSYTGYLYTLDEESGLLTRGDPFPIANGPNEHRAEFNIDDYAEFHIHVGTSMVNVYKATVPQ